MLGLSIGFTSYQCHGHARPRFGRPVVMSTPDVPFFSLSASEKRDSYEAQAVEFKEIHEFKAVGSKKTKEPALH